VRVNESGSLGGHSQNWEITGKEREPNLYIVFKKGSGSSTDLYFADAKKLPERKGAVL